MYYFQNSTTHFRYPNHHRKPPPWRVALLANLAGEAAPDPDSPPDAGAEFDSQETIEALAAALERDGHWVHICRADYTLTETLPNLRPDICFNIAEGVTGDSREAQVPALCEMLDIPYTASRILANALSLDKPQTKRVWLSQGLPTPHYQVFQTPNDALDPRLQLPLLVKPAREGTGMGIDQKAVVRTPAELKDRIAWVLQTYHQPALVEEFLPGREFTVGFIGNPGPTHARRRPWLYEASGYHVFPILELDSGQSSTPGVYGHAAKGVEIGGVGAPEYICPAPIPNELKNALVDLGLRAAEALDACDVSRVDIRLDAHGAPQLLEINTLPGLNPALSDLCIMAAAEGMSYDVLITEILYLAAERNGLPFEAAEREKIGHAGSRMTGLGYPVELEGALVAPPAKRERGAASRRPRSAGTRRR
jgi:D-alanine-D-alanine ligase